MTNERRESDPEGREIKRSWTITELVNGRIRMFSDKPDPTDEAFSVGCKSYDGRTFEDLLEILKAEMFGL